MLNGELERLNAEARELEVAISIEHITNNEAVRNALLETRHSPGIHATCRRGEERRISTGF